MTPRVSKVGSEEQGWDIQVLTEETAEEEALTFTGGKEFWSALTQKGEWKQPPPQRIWVPR